MKTKLTKEIIEEICKRLKVGCYAKMATAAIGIHESTYYRWLERGENALKLKMLGKKIPEDEKIFCELCESIRQSEAEGQINIVTMIFSQIKDDWKAGMEILARKWPEQWARKDFVDFKGSVETGPNKSEEARNEFKEMFGDVPRAKLSEIAMEMTRKLREAKTKYQQEKDLKNKQLQAPD
ncbi:MAG: hypothetical protein ACYDIA_02185 [Candidatus Humimicrobiaceae bacterium]